jgi:hypothetical protein
MLKKTDKYILYILKYKSRFFPRNDDRNQGDDLYMDSIFYKYFMLNFTFLVKNYGVDLYIRSTYTRVYTLHLSELTINKYESLFQLQV